VVDIEEEQGHGLTALSMLIEIDRQLAIEQQPVADSAPLSGVT
jgi:hypothetical protein